VIDFNANFAVRIFFSEFLEVFGTFAFGCVGGDDVAEFDDDGVGCLCVN
jgi:hypothetical protein